MKGLFFTLILLCSVVAIGQVKTAFDTLNGNEVVNFETISATGKYRSLAIDIKCTELGGTSDGTLVLQGRLDNNCEWSTLNSTDFGNWISFLANDTLTITDGAVWKVQLNDPAFRQYRIQGAGTASDTTLVTIRWAFKE